MCKTVNDDMFFGTTHHTFRLLGTDHLERLGAGIIQKLDESMRVRGPESFPFFALCLILHGHGGYVDCETGKYYPLHENMYFLRIPGVEHKILIDIESSWNEAFLSLGYHAYPYFKAFYGVSKDTPVGNFKPDEEWLHDFSLLELELAHCPEDDLFHVMLQMLKLASAVFRRPRPENELMALIRLACRYLDSNFNEKHDIQAFCLQHGYGYENFRKKFTEIIGIPPNQYRLKRRFEIARALLMRKQMTISDIASELGYCSPYEFSAKFKQKTGMTPTEFRNSNKYLYE